MINYYLVVYVLGKGENAGYAGYSPDVPGCVSCGDTLEEMRTMMKEALEFHLEDANPVPEPHETSVHFDPATRDEVERYFVEWLPVKVPTGVSSTVQQHEALPA